MKKHFSRVVAVLLCLIMVLSALPLTVFAANIYEASKEDDYYKLISKKDWELAPGVTESEIVLNNDSGTHRQVAHVVEVDINNEYTKVMPSYKGMAEGLNTKDYAVEVMSKQAAYAEANGYGNVVAAMNISLSWYNSDYYMQHPELVGEPLGYLVMDGVYYENSQGKTSGAVTCLVINFDKKEGEDRPADMPKVEIRSTADPITGWEEQVIPANFDFLVKDGKNQYSKDHTASSGASRSFIGVKADGTIVMVMNDGRQSPYSAGFTTYEMAEFMLSLGCVVAANGDGGGSSTFLSQRPGEDLKLNCSPSDGAERDTTHGILVISTAPATGEFQRATISSEYDYYTPNSNVNFSAVGSDLVGTAAEIPEDAKWQLSDSSYGTIDQNGVFVSNGKQGEVTAQIVYKGEVVGEHTIHIVMPDAISVVQDTMVVPYGKTVDLGLSATYDSKAVCIKASDITCTLSDNGIGTINGFNFTAAEEGTAHTKSDLTIKLGDISITIALSLGKGSEIVYDFESAEQRNLSNWYIGSWYPQYGPLGSKKDENGNYYYNGQNEIGALNIVTSANGKVKNGKYALAAFCDFTQTYETGYLGVKFKFPQEIDCTDAIAVGFWMYIPYDARHAEIRLIANNNASTVYDNGELWNLVEGWNYIKLDITQLANKTFQGFNIQVDDRACASTGDYYDYINEPNLNGKYTFYIDDISLDYSTAVDDREAPIFSGLQGLNGESGFKLDGTTVSNNKLSFEVNAKENTTLSNATGLNAASAKAYIDGKEVECKYANGKLSVTDITLANGIHTVKFEISDNAGNSSWVSGTFNVSTGNDNSTIVVVPKDPTADRLKIGSLYWMDVKATDIETVNSVEMVFDLNNASTWELEGLTVAEGFTATWSIQNDENIATIVITRTGKNDMTGEAVLASFPVRTWVSTITECEGYEDQTPTMLVKRGIIWAQSIELQLKKGVITYVEGYANETTGTFGMEDVLVDTELFFTYYSRKSVVGADDWIKACTSAGVGFHVHSVKNLDDKDATCTENGYTGRTYCDVCHSIVEWGTTVSAKGHKWEINSDSKLACENDPSELFNGVYTDGKTYVDGVVIADGWVEDTYYYVNGVKVTGRYVIDGTMYTFDENGVYQLHESYTGFHNDGIGWMYFLGNYQKKGFVVIGDSTHYFDDITGYAPIGSFTLAGDRVYKVEGEKGKVIGAWDTFIDNGIERKRYYYSLRYYKNQWLEIDGDQYYFDNNGYALIGKRAVAHMGAYLGGYEFADDGKLIGAITGPFTDFESGAMYFAENGVLACNKLVKYGNDYYFARNNYLLITWATTLTEEQTNGLLPAGEYKFGSDGKLQLLNGPVKDAYNEAYLNFYKNGIRIYEEGLYEYNGDYYYVRSNGLLMTWGMYITKTNGLLPAGEYKFGSDGKLQLLNGPVKDAYNEAYLNFYKNGIRIYEEGLYEYNGDYYYVRSNGLLMTWGMYITKTNGLLPAGEYKFGADGKLQLLNGPIEDAFNSSYLTFYKNGIRIYEEGLYEYDGNYYYVRSNGLLITWGTYVSDEKANGLVAAGEYQFGADGKMIK